MSCAEELSLVQLATIGEAWAIDRLIRRYERCVVQHLRRIVSDYHAAQDLAQEVFLRAVRGLAHLADRRSFRPWLFRIASNAGIDWLRRQPEPEVSIYPVTDFLAPIEDHPLSESPILSEGERDPYHPPLEAIARAMAGLPETTRRVFAARYLRGLSCCQVADEMGWTVANVKVRLHRGRRSIRARIRYPHSITTHQGEKQTRIRFSDSSHAELSSLWNPEWLHHYGRVYCPESIRIRSNF